MEENDRSAVERPAGEDPDGPPVSSPNKELFDVDRELEQFGGDRVFQALRASNGDPVDRRPTGDRAGHSGSNQSGPLELS
jgi:hypothetical protein